MVDPTLEVGWPLGVSRPKVRFYLYTDLEDGASGGVFQAPVGGTCRLNVILVPTQSLIEGTRQLPGSVGAAGAGRSKVLL